MKHLLSCLSLPLLLSACASAPTAPVSEIQWKCREQNSVKALECVPTAAEKMVRKGREPSTADKLSRKSQSSKAVK